MELNQQNKTDLLEIVIILAMVFLVVVIYLPVAIWEDEEHYQNESRYRMQNLYDVESFYSRLTGEYNPNFFEALSVVNAIRDSALADSLFIGEQLLNLSGKEFIVDVDESFGFDYDTTFGIKSFRKDTVKDTTLQIVIFDQDLGRNDTNFIRIRHQNTVPTTWTSLTWTNSKAKSWSPRRVALEKPPQCPCLYPQWPLTFPASRPSRDLA